MFSDRLTLIRLNRGLTQSELAHRLQIHENNIWRYEKGDVQPKADVLLLLAKELNVSADYLLGLTDYPGQYVEGELTPTEREAIAAWRRGDKVQAIKAIVGG